ncbi:MAG TPA: hypothetical protein VFA09_24690 [Ktedonobacteraceae bacterium]|nr:hypothetical protein [Ktedonobacteraceae bacterium]
MRLRRLWLGNYYNLKEVTIEFDPSPPIYGSTSIRFFVGLNGSGKSSALEAIGLIFSHLTAGAKPSIEFDIEYELRNQVIRITNRLENDFPLEPVSPIGAAVLIRSPSEDEWRQDHLRREWSSSGDAILPSRVIGYSTGPTSGLQWALSRSIERFVYNRLGDFEDERRPEGLSEEEWQENRQQMRALLEAERDDYLDNPDTLFLGSEDALCAVLPLLTHQPDAPESSDYLERRASILNRIGLDPREPLAAFTFHVTGDWEVRLTPNRARTLRSLLQKATVRRTIASIPTPNISNDEPPPSDFYAAFDFDEAFRTQELQKLIPTPLAFFEELLAWKRQGGVRRIRLVLKKQGIEDLFTESALSDGEFLYIGRYAVLLMLREVPEILVLLDEPETHFNDRWKVDLVKDIHTLINSQSGEQSDRIRNEVLIATHSGLTLTDADPRQVYKFVEREGKIFVEPPPISPFAANLGDISRTFSETERAIGNYANERIEEALRAGSREEIVQLVDEVVGPGFYRFRLLNKLEQLEEEKGE